MPTYDHKIPVSEITSSITINLRLVGMWRFRFAIWLLTQTVRFAAWIGQFNVIVDDQIHEE